MTAPTRILVESMAGVEAALGAAPGTKAVWYSTSPMVAERLGRDGVPFEWADTLLPAGLANEIGFAGLRAALELAPALERVADATGWPELGRQIVGPLHRLLTTLWFKAELLSRWATLPAARRVVVGEVALTAQTDGSLGPGRYDTLFIALAARGDLDGVERLEQSPEATDSFLKEIDQPVFTDRLLSLGDVSAGQVISRVSRFLSLGKSIRLRGGAPQVAILRDNETIREMLPALLLRGCSIRYVARPAAVKPAAPLAGLPDTIAITGILREAAGQMDCRADLVPVASCAADRLRDASAYWAGSISQADRALGGILRSEKETVLLSNSLAGTGNAALATVARRHGIPLVIAEHGVSAGLSRFHEPTRSLSEAGHGDAYLVSSPRARSFFLAEPALADRTIRVIGLPRQTRSVSRRWLPRVLARRRMGARGRERVVLYLTRHVQNNMRFLPHTPEDHEVHALQRMMADRVMPRVRGAPAIKLYSTRRYRDPDPLTGEFAAAPPVRTLKAGDFRYLRAGVDVIILESPLSTLGWAMGADKPVFYLAHPSLPLLPEARAALEDALIFFDLSDADWPEHLVASLNRPDPAIAAEWKVREPARKGFLDEFIVGPENAGRNGAKAVIAAARAGVMDGSPFHAEKAAG